MFCHSFDNMTVLLTFLIKHPPKVTLNEDLALINSITLLIFFPLTA